MDTSDGTRFNDLETFEEALHLAKAQVYILERADWYDPTWGPIRIVEGFGLLRVEVALLRNEAEKRKNAGSWPVKEDM
jgi:hypothetical protein